MPGQLMPGTNFSSPGSRSFELSRSAVMQKLHRFWRRWIELRSKLGSALSASAHWRCQAAHNRCAIGHPVTQCAL